jgi:hypothetical protein
VIDLPPMAQWKKLGLIAASTCALLILLVTIFWRSPRAASSGTQVNPWNSAAIQSTLTGVRVREVDPTHAAVVFLYDLENQTETDYELAGGPNVVIMSRLEPSGSLSSDRQASLESAAFVPAGNRTRIALEMSHPFNWPTERDATSERAIRQFVADEVTGLDGFVLFDQTTRYRIELPTASPQLQQSSMATGQN